jgi:aspartyl-tRNA(Asn)/glutamyl-tRNA(Gln) amidotransferase subunit A
MRPILALAADLAGGRTTSRALVDEALARIDDVQGEGGRTFVKVWHARARAEADHADALRKLGVPAASPLAGVPISVKDLFDVAGETTCAGSVVLKDKPPAAADAAIVRRLRAAGAILVGRTNMTEFAFSGIGINPHFDTPRNPWDRARGRIPGGSSSGAAISVTDGMCAGAIGSDTGGSVRIPAALCGLAGFKPTASRVPTKGAFPLSTTLDSVGPLANSVACCALLDAAMAGEDATVPAALPIRGMRLGVNRRMVMEQVDAAVAAAYEKALSRLSAAGALLISPPEAFALHRETLATRAEGMDALVATRIKRGAEMAASDYVDLIHARADVIARAHRRTRIYDAVVLPTCATVAPALDEVATPETFMQRNLLILRNTALFNFLDRCALTLPIHAPGEAPVGLMLVGENGADRDLLSAGLGVEAALA